MAASSRESKLPYMLYLLSEYTDTLDALPQDVSRTFADLRELDAVLSSNISNILNKVTYLTQLLENRAASGPSNDTPELQSQRFQLLCEIAEDATRLRAGGDDKIRVACLAADQARIAKTHLSAILSTLAGYDAAYAPNRLGHRTTYPHVAPNALIFDAAQGGEGAKQSRPRRTGMSLNAIPNESPQKKRKLDDDSKPRGGRKPRAITPDSLDSEPIQRPALAPELAAPTSKRRAGGGGSTTHLLDHVASQQEALGALEPDPEEVPGGVEQDEKLYCICNGVSWGEMIACDNDKCAKEWFHLDCLNMNNPPKGTWLCDECRAARAAKKAKTNAKKKRNNSGAPRGGGAAGSRALASAVLNPISFS